MDKTYRVSAIWEISADTDKRQGSNHFSRPGSRQTSFDFAPFFTEACEEVDDRRVAGRVSSMVPVSRMQVSPFIRLQRA